MNGVLLYASAVGFVTLVLSGLGGRDRTPFLATYAVVFVAAPFVLLAAVVAVVARGLAGPRPVRQVNAWDDLWGRR